MNKKMISVFSMLLFLLMACQPTTPEEVVLPPTATVPSPDMIINDAIDAWNAGDVATLKTLFAGDAVVCFPDWGDECTTGTEEIGAWIEAVSAEVVDVLFFRWIVTEDITHIRSRCGISFFEVA